MIRSRDEGGFTLPELLVCMVLLAIVLARVRVDADHELEDEQPRRGAGAPPDRGSRVDRAADHGLPRGDEHAQHLAGRQRRPRDADVRRTRSCDAVPPPPDLVSHRQRQSPAQHGDEHRHRRLAVGLPGHACTVDRRADIDQERKHVFTFYDQNGVATTDPAAVHCVRVSLTVAPKLRPGRTDTPTAHSSRSGRSSEAASFGRGRNRDAHRARAHGAPERARRRADRRHERRGIAQPHSREARRRVPGCGGRRRRLHLEAHRRPPLLLPLRPPGRGDAPGGHGGAFRQPPRRRGCRPTAAAGRTRAARTRGTARRSSATATSTTSRSCPRRRRSR